MPKILHIEDDAANRLLVRKLLTLAGFDVVEAEDGIEGIRKAKSERPDLVLVDIAIPGLDGYEVTLRLRSEQELEGVPIVAITAEGDRDTSLAVGCDGFLQKPIDARSFAQTLRGYLGGLREQARPERAGEHLRLQSQRIVGHLEEKLSELSLANERLLEAERARKEFYRNVSHELATPMTPIVGYVKLLADEELGPLSPAQRKALRSMDECVARLRGLIDNLLDVTGIETGRLRFAQREYDLGDLASAVVARAAARPEAKERRLLYDAPASALPGLGDPARITRAIELLLDNALKFTAPGATVALRVRLASDGLYELCVADDGPGVQPGAEARIFEPFAQGDGSPTRRHGGAGVGLAIVRGVAEGHGGVARVVSPASESISGARLTGAAFYVTLRAAPEPDEHTPQA